jgi:hypothetical protein
MRIRREAHGYAGAMGNILKGLDVFALTDADTDEAKAFTTYLGYWVSLAEHVNLIYGDPPYAALHASLRDQGLGKLAGKPLAGDPDVLRSALLNAWSSELALYLVDLENAERLWLGNQWAQVQSYYATSRAASAWLVAHQGTAPDTHSGLLRAMSAQVTGMRIYPCPWSLTCSAVGPPPVYGGFPSPPTAISNLSVDADPFDRCAMMLRTTRDRDVTRHVEQVKRQLKKSRAPNGEYSRQDGRVRATSVFDFAWRTRTRSNYGDPAMFYVGTLTPERSREYASAIRAVTTATMFLFEAMIAQKAKTVLDDAATHFTARDRARISDLVIVPRLRELGLLS